MLWYTLMVIVSCSHCFIVLIQEYPDEYQEMLVALEMVIVVIISLVHIGSII